MPMQSHHRLEFNTVGFWLNTAVLITPGLGADHRADAGRDCV